MLYLRSRAREAYPHCMGLTNWLQRQNGSLGRSLSKLPVSLVGLLPEQMLRPQGPSMSPAQRTIILDRLDISRHDFINCIDSLSDIQWQWKPAAGKWSIAAIAEHVSLVEEMLFDKLQEALHNPIDPDWKKKTAGKTEFLLRIVARRRGRVTALDSLVPTGNWTRGQTLARFHEARAATIRFAKETEAEVNARTAEHPSATFSTLSAYQWLLYIPLHLERHMKQIDEIRATADFP
jgi:hypothetical protein